VSNIEWGDGGVGGNALARFETCPTLEQIRKLARGLLGGLWHAHCYASGSSLSGRDSRLRGDFSKTGLGSCGRMAIRRESGRGR